MKNLFLFLSLFLMCASCGHNDDNMWVNIQSLQNGNIVNGTDEEGNDGGERIFPTEGIQVTFPTDCYVGRIKSIYQNVEGKVAMRIVSQSGVRESMRNYGMSEIYFDPADMEGQDLSEGSLIAFNYVVPPHDVDGHDECVITPYREEGQESPFRFPEDGYVAQVYYISNENGRLIASLDPVSKGFEESIGIWWGDYARFYMVCADFGEQELQEKDFIVFRMKSQERIVTEGAETEPGYLCSVVPYFIAAQ